MNKEKVLHCFFLWTILHDIRRRTSTVGVHLPWTCGFNQLIYSAFAMDGCSVIGSYPVTRFCVFRNSTVKLHSKFTTSLPCLFCTGLRACEVIQSCVECKSFALCNDTDDEDFFMSGQVPNIPQSWSQYSGELIARQHTTSVLGVLCTPLTKTSNSYGLYGAPDLRRTVFLVKLIYTNRLGLVVPGLGLLQMVFGGKIFIQCVADSGVWNARFDSTRKSEIILPWFFETF